ncbi:hypothetical protein PINS_up016742 [Pythium insidiosum]|nr:hypothetical protein PINS_up016742 [Pythium insidiosum]
MVRLVSLTALSLAAAVPLASAHTNMIDPQPNWPANFYNGNSPYGRIDGDKFQSSVPNWQGASRINDVLKSTGASSLRDFIYKNIVTEKDKECGNSLMTGPKRTLGNEINFPWGHPGPCERGATTTRFSSTRTARATTWGRSRWTRASVRTRSVCRCFTWART